MTPIEISLKVRARIWQEGLWWIVDCPAFGVVVQMSSERAARREFGQVLREVLEISRERGTYDALIRQAAAHPETLWEEQAQASRMVDVQVPLPVSYLANWHDARQAA